MTGFAVLIAALMLLTATEAAPAEVGAAEAAEEPRQLIEDKGTGRVLTSFIFPFFRQYQNIDLGANLNNLKSANTATFFIVRDVIVVSIII